MRGDSKNHFVDLETRLGLHTRSHICSECFQSGTGYDGRIDSPRLGNLPALLCDDRRGDGPFPHGVDAPVHLGLVVGDDHDLCYGRDRDLVGEGDQGLFLSLGFRDSLTSCQICSPTVLEGQDVFCGCVFVPGFLAISCPR